MLFELKAKLETADPPNSVLLLESAEKVDPVFVKMFVFPKIPFPTARNSPLMATLVSVGSVSERSF